MKFKYRPASVQLDADSPPVTVYRPILRIRVAGPEGKTKIRALADTGADCSVFSVEVSDRLGIDLRTDRPVEVCGIGDNEVELYAGDINLENKTFGQFHPLDFIHSVWRCRNQSPWPTWFL